MDRNYTILSDDKLIALLRESDQCAFKQLYDLYSPPVYSFAKRTLQDDCLADDVLQEVFIILWEKRHHLKIESNFRNYLFGITKNRALKSIGKSKQLESYLNTLEKTIASYEASPEEIVIQNERTEIVELEIKRLPERMQTILNLSRSGEYTYQEIAEKLNVSKGAIADQVYHASKKLRFRLERLFSILF